LAIEWRVFKKARATKAKICAEHRRHIFMQIPWCSLDAKDSAVKPTD
jgi:hypothetical protein